MSGNIVADSAIVTKPDTTQADVDLLNKLQEWLKEAEGSNAEIKFREEYIEDNKFYAGDQDTNEVKSELIDKQRPNTTYNIILPKINMLTGLAAQSHRSPYVFPVTTEDEAMTELMNGVLKHYRRKLDLLDREVDSFDKAIKGGRCYLHLYVSNENPFKSELKAVIIDGNKCLPDPTSTEYDMSDARYFFADEWFGKDTIMSRWPQMIEEDFTTMSSNANAAGPNYYDTVKNMYRISQCWYFKYEKMCWFKDPRTQIAKSVTPAQWAILEAGYKETQQPAPQMLTATNRRCYFAIFSGTKILDQGASPYTHNKIPYILFGAYRSDYENRWFSVINMMKDPQRGLNTIRRQLVHLLQTLPKGILVHEVGAIINIDEYETRSSDPSFHLELGKDAMTKYKFEQQPQISPIYGQLDGMFVQSTKDTSGIQDSLMGEQTSSREPGVTVRLRQETGVAVLHILFHNLRKSRLLSCKMLLSMIQQYVTDQEIIRIEGEEGTKLQAINSQMNPGSEGFNDVSYLEYDMDIDEVADNATMRSAILEMLMNFSQNNPGTIPPDLIFEYSDLPISAKLRVREYNKQEQERKDKMFAVEQGIKMQEINAKANLASKPQGGK